MSRKKLVTYLLIFVALMMILDVKYVNSNNNLFSGFITESIEKVIEKENIFFQNNKNQDSIKAKKDGSLKLGEEFLKENRKINSFNLKNDFGSIKLQGSQKDEININYTLKIHAEDKNEAEDFIQDLKVNYNLDGKNLIISLNKNQIETPEKIKAIEIDYRITVPEDLKTELANNYGKLSLSDLKAEVKASNHYGSTLITNIRKDVVLDLAYGQSKINNLASSLDLNSSYAENNIKNIKGEFVLENSYGFNKIANLESDLQINSRYGEMEINSAQNIDLKSRYTGFKISDVKGEIRADSEYGYFELDWIEDLDLKLRYTNVEINSLKDYELYNYDLNVKYGNIEANSDVFNYDNQEQLKYQGQQAEYEIQINSEYSNVEIK